MTTPYKAMPHGFDGSRGIEYLKLSNIGRFTSMRLDFSPGGITELRGGNGQGKTTIISALIAALTSQRAEDIDKLVRLGEEGGSIETVIAGVKIVKVFKNGELQGLDLIDESGTKFQKPQTLLDAAFKGTFLNPFDLLAASDRERMRAIAKTIHLDLGRVRELLTEIVEPERQPQLLNVEDVFPAIDRLRKTLEEERVLAGRELRAAEARTQALYQVVPADFDPETCPRPVEPAPLSDIYQRRDLVNARNRRRQELAGQVAREEAEVSRLEEQLASARLRLQDAQREEFELGGTESTVAYDEQIEQHEQLMAAWREAVKVHGDHTHRYEEAKRSADAEGPLRIGYQELDDAVKALAVLPEKLLVGVEMPVEGMLVNGDQVFLKNDEGNYLPLSAFGEAEQLLFCIRVAMALAPAPFILIDGIERCDPASSQRLYQYITERGFQAVCTRVTDGPLTPVSVSPAPLAGPTWPSDEQPTLL